MSDKSNCYEAFKKQLLMDYFLQICQFSPSIDKFNFWFLGILSVTSNILFYQLDVLNQYFSLAHVGFVFLFLAISGFLGILSAYFANIAQSCYTITKQMVSSRNEIYETAILFDDNTWSSLFHDFMIEIQQRIFPRPLIFLSNIFYKFFKPDIFNMIVYELPAKFVVLQLLFLSLQVFSYIISILLLASYFILH